MNRHGGRNRRKSCRLRYSRVHGATLTTDEGAGAAREHPTDVNDAEWSRLKSCLTLTRGILREGRSDMQQLDHIRSGGLDG